MTTITPEKIAELRALARGSFEHVGQAVFADQELLFAIFDLAESALWRTDWENAPQDGTEILARYQWLGEHRYMVIRRHKKYPWWLSGSRVVQDDKSDSHRNFDFTHFRPITPPEQSDG